MLVVVFLAVLAMLAVIVGTYMRRNHIDRHGLMAFFHRNRLPEITSTVMALAMFGIGLSLFVVPEVYLSQPTFDQTFAIAPPKAWSVAMCMAALWMCGALALGDRLGLTFTQITVCFVWVAWSLTLVGSLGDGVPSATVIYLSLSFLAAVNALIYASEYAEGIRR